MVDLSWQTYYLAELFNPADGRLGHGLIPFHYKYISSEESDDFVTPMSKILSLKFAWSDRSNAHRFHLFFLKHFRYLIGWPRPVLKDPVAVFSAEWCADNFAMDVICLVRHPAAFAASLKKAKWSAGFKSLLAQPNLMEEWLYPYADQMMHPSSNFYERAALLWVCIYYVLTAYIERHPEWDVRRVEDISRYPVESYKSIYHYLGLPFTPGIERTIREYSYAENGGESKENSLHLIKRHSKTAQNWWRKVISADDLMKIRRITEAVSFHYYQEIDWSRR